MLTLYYLYCMHFLVAPSGVRAGLKLFTLATLTPKQQ